MCVAELVEEAVVDIFVDGEVFNGTDNDFAELSGVDKVVEMDDLFGVKVYKGIGGGVVAVGGKSHESFSGEDESGEVAVADNLAFESAVAVMFGITYAVDGFLVYVLGVFVIEPSVAEPMVCGFGEGVGGAVVEAALEQFEGDVG